ncbi:MAG: antibiotic biosynthesis monooxygenase, partial [Chloroflexi bacterium]|nr:antibiotic biosynthesis monooxygenase [Chloroflexota bacterium]
TAASPTPGHDGHVTLINCFEVPDGSQAQFYAQWQTMNAFFRAQPGYLANRLHRALTPAARYQVVNVTEWAFDADYQAAHGERVCRRAMSASSAARAAVAAVPPSGRGRPPRCAPRGGAAAAEPRSHPAATAY